MKLQLQSILSDRQYRAALHVEETLTRAGFVAYMVGGSVRDLLLGVRPADVDFTTDATPDEVIPLFKHVVPVGKEFGTVLITFEKLPIEITTFRLETEYLDGRRPSSVHFGKSLEEDVLRRDFTINGMAIQASTGEVFDYTGGLKDLKSRIIRTIGDPLERFREDGLRTVRACRFAARLGFELDASVVEAIRESRENAGRVAIERFFDEWRKTIPAKFRGRFFSLMEKTGLFAVFFPEMSHLHGREAAVFLENLFNSVRIKGMGEYAAYLFAAEQYFSGDMSSVEFARKNMQRLRFPAREMKVALSLLQSPFLREYPAGMEEVRKKLSALPRTEIARHLRFVSGWHCYADPGGNLCSQKVKLFREVYAALRKKDPIYVKDLVIDGNDLLAMGVKGAEVGDQLRALLAYVHHDPANNVREFLLSQAKPSK